MKELRTNMDKWFAKMDERWRALPVGKQHKYTLYFFTGYLLLTAGVIFKVWSDTAKSDNSIVIKHIENPAPQNERKSYALAGHITDNSKK